MTKLLLCRTAGAFALLWPAVSVAQTPVDCARNPDQARWFVRAGAPATVPERTRARSPRSPTSSAARRAGATITVLAPADGAAPLDGGIRLKERQKLLGIAPTPGGKPAARLTNTAGSGDAVTLAHGNEVAHLHIDNPAGAAPAGAAIFGDNVNGDAPSRSAADTPRDRGADPARPVAVPRRQDRRCRGHEPVGPARLQRAAGRRPRQVRDRAAGGRRRRRGEREVLDSAAGHSGQSGSRTAAIPVAGGVYLSAAGRVSALLEMQDSSVENARSGP